MSLNLLREFRQRRDEIFLEHKIADNPISKAAAAQQAIADIRAERHRQSIESTDADRGANADGPDLDVLFSKLEQMHERAKKRGEILAIPPRTEPFPTTPEGFLRMLEEDDARALAVRGAMPAAEPLAEPITIERVAHASETVAKPPPETPKQTYSQPVAKAKTHKTAVERRKSHGITPDTEPVLAIYQPRNDGPRFINDEFSNSPLHDDPVTALWRSQQG